MLPRTQEKASSSDEEDLGSAGLTAFFNLAGQWELSPEQQRILLGNPPRSTFYKWKKARAGRLNQDTLERISYLLGIYKALQILLPSTQAASEWIKKPNKAALFGGRSALDRMLGGRVIDLADVRRYLDGWRG